jgi:hypothetical protein
LMSELNDINALTRGGIASTRPAIETESAMASSEHFVTDYFLLFVECVIIRPCRKHRENLS